VILVCGHGVERRQRQHVPVRPQKNNAQKMKGTMLNSRVKRTGLIVAFSFFKEAKYLSSSFVRDKVGTSEDSCPCASFISNHEHAPTTDFFNDQPLCGKNLLSQSLSRPHGQSYSRDNEIQW